MIPGLELTYNEPDPGLSAHALAVGLRRFVSVDEGIDGAIESAIDDGAALIAAHPYDDEPSPHPGRLTQRFARDPELRRACTDSSSSTEPSSSPGSPGRVFPASRAAISTGWSTSRGGRA